MLFVTTMNTEYWTETVTNGNCDLIHWWLVTNTLANSIHALSLMRRWKAKNTLAFCLCSWAVSLVTAGCGYVYLPIEGSTDCCSCNYYRPMTKCKTVNPQKYNVTRFRKWLKLHTQHRHHHHDHTEGRWCEYSTNCQTAWPMMKQSTVYSVRLGTYCTSSVLCTIWTNSPAVLKTACEKKTRVAGTLQLY